MASTRFDTDQLELIERIGIAYSGENRYITFEQAAWLRELVCAYELSRVSGLLNVLEQYPWLCENDFRDLLPV